MSANLSLSQSLGRIERHLNKMWRSDEITNCFISLAATMATAGSGLPMMVRNDERPQLATLIISTRAILNIALNYLFIVV